MWLVVIFTIVVLRFDRGIVAMVVLGCNFHHCCFRYDRGVVRIVVGYNYYHYWLWFDREVGRVVVVDYVVHHYCYGLTE